MKKPTKQQFLSAADCAAQLGIAERTAVRLLAAGSLRGFQAGRKWRVTEMDLRNYIVSRTNSFRVQEAA